jgi:hypothetical protein
MRADLLHAQASIDWAVSQFPSLNERITVWVNANIKTIIKDPDPNVPNNVVVAVEKEPLPLSFIVETGAYIHSIRSALDILATSLAYRYQMPNPEDVYFPVAVSEKVFMSGGYKGVDFVQGLPSTERAIIECLKPYQGGNELLWALHRLDITRKHKRLLDTAIWPRKFAVMGWWNTGDFTPVGDWISVNGETVLGLLKKGTGAQIYFTPYIAIHEPLLMGRKPLITALDEFASYASSIVAMFDMP